MLKIKVLIFELITVDGLAARAITPRKITALKHEPGNNPMEAATRIAESLLIRAKSAEVFCGNWYFLAVEPEDDSSRWAIVHSKVEVDV